MLLTGNPMKFRILPCRFLKKSENKWSSTNEFWMQTKIKRILTKFFPLIFVFHLFPTDRNYLLDHERARAVTQKFYWVKTGDIILWYIHIKEFLSWTFWRSYLEELFSVTIQAINTIRELHIGCLWNTFGDLHLNKQYFTFLQRTKTSDYSKPKNSDPELLRIYE